MTVPHPPPWPANFQGATLHGQWIDFLGNPIVGDLTIAPSPEVLLDYPALLTIVPRSVTFTLDAAGFLADNSGSRNVVVPATDDPDISPIEWTYSVTENWIGGRSYSIEAPQGTTVDLTLVQPVPDANGTPIVRGPRGLDGSVQRVMLQVPDSAGNVDLTDIVMLRANNLGDLLNVTEARRSLGLGDAALRNSTYFATAAQQATLTDRVTADEAALGSAANHDAQEWAQGWLGDVSNSTAVPLHTDGQTYDGLAVVAVTLATPRRLRVVTQADFALDPTSGALGRYGIVCAWSPGPPTHPNFKGSWATTFGPSNRLNINGTNSSGTLSVEGTVDLPAGAYFLSSLVSRPGASGGANDTASRFYTAVHDAGPGSGSVIVTPPPPVTPPPVIPRALFGAYMQPLSTSETLTQANTRGDNAMGPLDIIRVYDGGGKGAAYAKTAAVNSGVLNSRACILSFHFSPTEIVAGTHNAELVSFFTGLPASVYWSYYHEMDKAVNKGTFTAAQWKAAWQYIYNLSKTTNSRAKATPIWTGYNFTVSDSKFPGGRFAALYPGNTYVDVICWDPYTTTPGQTAAQLVDPLLAAIASTGKPGAVAETGTDYATPSTTATAAFASSWAARANQLEFVAWFNSTGGGIRVSTDTIDFSIDRKPAAATAWGNVVNG